MDEITKHVATHVTGDQGSGQNFTCNTTSGGSDTLTYNHKIAIKSTSTVMREGEE
jgi:hypothetical protein